MAKRKHAANAVYHNNVRNILANGWPTRLRWIVREGAVFGRFWVSLATRKTAKLSTHKSPKLTVDKADTIKCEWHSSRLKRRTGELWYV